MVLVIIEAPILNPHDSPYSSPYRSLYKEPSSNYVSPYIITLPFSASALPRGQGLEAK